MRSTDTAVDADDVCRTLALALDTLRDAEPRAWEAKAGTPRLDVLEDARAPGR
ncbi:hypothetical protein [Streptomyces sp. NPDC058572]|uniref:hypothetical protein n=1 Tax=Streptomyces sp. NPDC058572 TaxID=3346546 RepID=UPI00364EFF5C